VSLEIVPRSAGGEFGRVVNARHAALAEAVASWVARKPGWKVATEVSFSIYGDRGVVDRLARRHWLAGRYRAEDRDRRCQ
jgi:hypothetical protein